MWRDKTKRRDFFEKMAKENLFDPLISKNWYDFGINKIMSIKVLNK